MINKLAALIEEKRLKLAKRLIDLDDSRVLLHRYQEWQSDDAGCALSSFMEDKWLEQYAELDTLCELLEECEQMNYELDDLRRNAYIGRQLKQLINMAV